MPSLLLEQAAPVYTQDTVTPYRLLAKEYDQGQHQTTRVLEALSREGLRRASQDVLGRNVRRILEIGAGTGALTDALLSTFPDAHVVASDPAPEMLTALRAKLGSISRLQVVPEDLAQITRADSGYTPDLVAAGLADPFLDGSAVRMFRALTASCSRLFISVPSRGWAIRERLDRLRVSVDTTRFRMANKSVVLAPSRTYDEDALRELLADARLLPIATGTEQSSMIWTRPEVSWAIAVPL